jgi:transposase-like protein
MTAALTEPRFKDDDAARQHLEAIRWPNGPVCPHCGGTERNSALAGESHRDGLYFCGDCRTQFTVTVGTVFERSKVPLHKWVLATHLLCASKKGMSSKQLERMLGVTYKTAWFMSHRIREAMKPNGGGMLGGGGKIVEADETFWGTEPGKTKRAGVGHKMKVMALVERGGNVRSFRISDMKLSTMKEVLAKNVHPETHLMTDDAWQYFKLGKEFKKHSSVNHSIKEYARGNVTTNTIEGVFSIFKRGLVGTYHHIGSQHLERYTSEFDFSYNNREKVGINDEQRTDNALKGISGKRLTYRRTHAEQQGGR